VARQRNNGSPKAEQPSAPAASRRVPGRRMVKPPVSVNAGCRSLLRARLRPDVCGVSFGVLPEFLGTAVVAFCSKPDIAQKEWSYAQTGFCGFAVCRDDVCHRRDLCPRICVVLPRIWLRGTGLRLLTVALPPKILLRRLLSPTRLGMAWWMGRLAWWMGRSGLGMAWWMGRSTLGLEALVIRTQL
jgi:hypothetical protein